VTKFSIRGLGIGTKITLCMALIIILSLGALSFTSFSYTANLMQDSIKSDLVNNDVKNNAKFLSQQLKSYESDVENIALQQNLYSMSWSDQKMVLTQSTQNNHFINMGISDPSGNVRYSDGRNSNISGSDYFKTAINGKTAISDPVSNSFYISTPIKDEDGKIDGVLIATIDIKTLNAFASSLLDDSISGSLIISSDGTIIVSQPQSMDNQSSKMQATSDDNQMGTNMSKIDKSFVSGKTSLEQIKINNTISYMAYTPIPGFNWSLGIMSKPNNLFANVNTLMSRIIILSILFVLTAVIICMLLIWLMVTKPLQKAVHMIQKLSSGHLDERLKIRSKDEVGRMADAMNSFADSLQKNVVGIMKNISDGNLSDDIQVSGPKDQITPTLINTVETIRLITNETQSIIDAAKNGNLDERCNSKNYHGIWQVLSVQLNHYRLKPVGSVRG
jgi:methyl-accepting chemotaxis protein